MTGLFSQYTDVLAMLTTQGYANVNLYQQIRADEKRQGVKNTYNERAMNLFLAQIERRAFRMAEIATGNREEALDLVQDAMLALVKHYADKPETEWAPLFNRILQSKIRDWYRRSSVRNRVLDWLGLQSKDQDEQIDPIQQAADQQGRDPQQEEDNSAAGRALDQALSRLPLRQQQAFLLRNWQGLDVRETADAMACSQGSVKTHYSRAVKKLRAELEEYYEPGR